MNSQSNSRIDAPFLSVIEESDNVCTGMNALAPSIQHGAQAIQVICELLSATATNASVLNAERLSQRQIAGLVDAVHLIASVINTRAEQIEAQQRSQR